MAKYQVLLVAAILQVSVSLILLLKHTTSCNIHSHNNFLDVDLPREQQRRTPQESTTTSSSPPQIIEKQQAVVVKKSSALRILDTAAEANTHPCKKTVHSEERIWFALPSWNKSKLLKRALQSLIDQQDIGYAQIKVVVFEDYSKDMLTEEDKAYYRSLTATASHVDFVFLREPGSPIKSKGSAFGKWSLFEYIRDKALPHEYVFILDGDDTLSDRKVVRYLFTKLHRYRPMFAWGRHNGKYSEQCADLDRSKFPEKPDQPYTLQIRKGVWSFCHPRMFQAHLLRELNVKEFQRNDGSWLQKATDRPFIFKFMELAGLDNIRFLGDRPVYNYTFTSDNGLTRFSKSLITGDKELVNNRPPAPPAPYNLHVVACVYHRNNTEIFLSKLIQSRLPPGLVLNIHICNNNRQRQLELERLASKLMLEYGSKRRYLKIYQMDYNMGGYSRFVLARRIMERTYVEYVIMMDDDQYVRPLSVSRIHKAREPQAYKTWYGKNWEPDERSYWRPKDRLPVDPNYRGRRSQDISTWQYGGTGMSIVDASIFTIRELFQLEYRYRFVEDVWLSYIVQLLKGWKIGRLNIKFDFPGPEFSAKTGQFTGLRALKDQMFRDLGYLRCSLDEKEAAK